MLSLIISAILWLAPNVGYQRAEVYATAIHVESQRRRVDPLLVVAIAYRESRFRPWKTAAGNYGLMQLRVTPTLNDDFWGREQALLEPRTNVRRGVKWLALWRGYHERSCGSDHHWWAHYQWGTRVRNPGSGNRVNLIYQLLKERFHDTAVS
jgi:hypothetical protein